MLVMRAVREYEACYDEESVLGMGKRKVGEGDVVLSGQMRRDGVAVEGGAGFVCGHFDLSRFRLWVYVCTIDICFMYDRSLR